MRFLRVLVLVLVLAGAARADWAVHVNSNSVSCVLPVSGGLWWGSSGGAVFYNSSAGTFQKVVRSETGLRSNDITSLAVDSAGAVWMGTAGRGVCILDGDGRWRFINTQTLGLLSDYVLDIAVSGSLVAVGTSGGVSLFDGGVLETFFSGIDWGKSGCDSAIAVSLDGSRLLVGTRCGLFEYVLGGNQWSAVYPDTRFHDIDSDGGSLFWALTGDSIFTYDGDTVGRISKRYIRNDHLRAISAFDTTAWVMTDRGPARYDGANEWWVFNRDGIPEDLWDGTALAVDAGGAAWAGTLHGALRLLDGTWQMLESAGPYGNYINDITLDSKGRVWCTTGFRFGGAPYDANRGVYMYDGEEWTRFSREVLPSRMAYSIDSSPIDGSVWIGFWDAGSGDLLRYEMADTGFTSYGDILQSRVISDVLVAGDGSVIFGQYSGSTSFGVLFGGYRSVVYYTPFDEPPCVSSPYILAFGEGQPDCYLIGDYNSSPEGSDPEIAMLCAGPSWSSKQDDDCMSWSPLEGWPQGSVYALATDPYGVMWCGTSAGLGSYDGSWHSVNTTIGVVWDVEITPDGTKWVGSDAGLLELRGQGAVWSDFEGSRRAYNSTNSLLPPQAVKAVEARADGSLWIGTAGGGVYRFKPEGGTSQKLSAWVEAYPNPYDESRQDYDAPVRFEGYKPGSTVRIYTIHGELVAEVDANEAWDVRNENGENVVSGIYIFHTYAENGSEFLGKIVVIR
jgi:hypothetical protein